jgi:hypothetical protein
MRKRRVAAGLHPATSDRSEKISPRWGRNSNSPSEDPLHTGLWGHYLVLGTQSTVEGVNLINSQMKHWTAYGVESNRMGFNGNVSVHDMSETYMRPLQLMLAANVSSAMCAYDAINVRPPIAFCLGLHVLELNYAGIIVSLWSSSGHTIMCVQHLPCSLCSVMKLRVDDCAALHIVSRREWLDESHGAPKALGI